MANDCTTLTLVDAVQGESAPLLAEKQDCGVEARDCHGGTCSAAPVAQNKFSSKEAIANQTPELVEQGNPTLLLVENSVSGVEAKTVHEGESFTAPVTSAEKWSHEAIVAFVKCATGAYAETHALREIWGRIRSLTFCSHVGMMIPRKQIVVKKMLAKFPQWGIACVDGVLVDWEE
ncbi:hypothetical protein [Nostoc flagelliforme]|uniref:hypothetical protein n=1 Tax=Nostoc flagelliforme TaxID=1306274 RepID=UPI001F55730B|nr:hypothetical protein [Nostoc flagelliforme]